jgi:CBS-domain-containing membrane protein
MWNHDCGAIAVIDSDGKLVGMLTDRDICMAAYTQGQALRDIPVASAMATKVYSCQAGEPVVVAERLMRDNQIRRVPIVDADNRPVGLLSLNDVARHAAAARTAGAEHALTETMAAICAARTSASTAILPATPAEQEPMYAAV